MRYFLALISIIIAFCLLGVTRYVSDLWDSRSLRAVLELHKSDKTTVTRFIERASLTCMPDLRDLVSTKARNVVPQIVALAILPTEELKSEPGRKEKLIASIVKPAWDNAPNKDLMILSKALNKMNSPFSTFDSCVARTIVGLSDQYQRDREKTSLAKTPLRGS